MKRDALLVALLAGLLLAAFFFAWAAGDGKRTDQHGVQLREQWDKVYRMGMACPCRCDCKACPCLSEITEVKP